MSLFLCKKHNVIVLSNSTKACGELWKREGSDENFIFIMKYYGLVMQRSNIHFNFDLFNITEKRIFTPNEYLKEFPE